jgi:hypothetical protein
MRIGVQRSWRRHAAMTGIVVPLLAAVASLAGAATAKNSDNRLPGLSGYWRLVEKTGAEPVLTERGRTEAAKPGHKGDIDIEGSRWCVFEGVPYVMDNAGPIEIRQSSAETIIIAERLAVPRHIYFRLKPPTADTFDFTPVGMSTGRRVRNVLVVNTSMFQDGLGPEGAPRTEKAKMLERLQVSDGGKTLLVTTTWDDPAIFTKPYVYRLRYARVSEPYRVQEYYCDPRANGVGNYPPGEDPRGKPAQQ